MKMSLVALGLLAATACSDTKGLTEVGSAVAGEVTAVRTANGVRIHNGTTVAVLYVVWDRGFLGLLAHCDESCPKLQAGEAITVQPGMDGFAGTGDTAVYWWRWPGTDQALNTIILPQP
jgi:hypothetical protein